MLKQKVWDNAKWDATLHKHWSDGRFPEYALIEDLSNEDLQNEYLNKVKELALEGKKGDDKYFNSYVLCIRIEMAHRLENGLVQFSDDKNTILNEREVSSTEVSDIINGGETNKDAELQNSHRIIKTQSAKISRLQANLKIKYCPPREELFVIADRNRKINYKLNFSKIAKELGKDRKTVQTWCRRHGIE